MKQHLKKGSKGWTHCNERPANPFRTLTEEISETTCHNCLMEAIKNIDEEIERKRIKKYKLAKQMGRLANGPPETPK